MTPVPARVNLTNGDHIITDADVTDVAGQIQQGLDANTLVLLVDSRGRERHVNPAAVAEIVENARSFS